MTKRARDLVFDFGAAENAPTPHIHIGQYIGAPELNGFFEETSTDETSQEYYELEPVDEVPEAVVENPEIEIGKNF